ncbi:MAG: carbonic anhydrase [Armatimonadetes bacterium]|nr:carbonic anhydrase [Armatimonadota bacterium]
MRRRFGLRTWAVGGVALFVAVGLGVAAGGHGGADGAARLKEGNARFAAGRAVHPDQTAALRAKLDAGQTPFAVVVTCSDSRVPPELLFDFGLGDLFVVRTAGEVVDQVALGSVEYAVEHLHVPLVVVMGHSKCGAVKATMECVQAGGAAPEGGIGALVKAITPAVEDAKKLPGDLLPNAVTAQVKRTVALLRTSAGPMTEAVSAGHTRVVGAVYELGSGQVRWLD